MKKKVLGGALGAALVLGAISAPGDASPTARTAAAVTDGPIIYETNSMTPLMRGLDGTPSYRLPTDSVAGLTYSEFSPDGERLAHVDGCHGSGCTKVAVRLLDAGRSRTTVLAATDDHIAALAWSPDGSRLAVMLQDGLTTAGRIETIEVATGLWTPVVASSADLELNSLGGLTWGAGDQLAFVASEVDESGNAAAGHRDQIYVVAAGGGTPEPFLAASAEDRRYRYPVWSPDGTTVAAFMDLDDPDGDNDYSDARRELVVAVPGQVEPSRVVDLPPGWTCDGGQCSGGLPPSGAWAEWSVDGSRLLYVYDATPADDDSRRTVRLVTVDTGLVEPVSVPTTGEPRDWQPCPSGTCADFRLALPSEPLAVTARPGPDGGRRTISVRWAEPAVGAPFVRYYVQLVNTTNGEKDVQWIDAGQKPEPYYFDSGRWKFRVQAANARGRGPWSAYTAAVRPR